jgi:hypothetical protein
MTPQQHETLFEIFQRQPMEDGRVAVSELRTRNYYTNETFDEFLSRSTFAFGDTCIMIEWQKMWIGIEEDGYAHT